MRSTPNHLAARIVATALGRHHNDPDNWGDRCLCGGWRYHTHREGLWENHAAGAALAALHAAGYAVVKLPEPDEDGSWPIELPRQRGTSYVYTYSKLIEYTKYANSIDSARALAAALLAAADAAESS